MGIKNNKNLFDAIEHMLQGLAYWLGYRKECYAGHDIMEAVAVETAMSILNAHINHDVYKVKCEHAFRLIAPSLSSSGKRADIAIVEKGNNHTVCVIEFKRASDANGNVWEDIKKLKEIPSQVHRLVVLLAQHNESIVYDFINKNGNALRRIKSEVPVKVIRSAKAMETEKQSKSPYRAICIELATQTMNIFSQQERIPQMVEEDCRRWSMQKKEEDYLGKMILGQHVMFVGTIDPNGFSEKVEVLVNPSEQHFSPTVKNHTGRLVKRIDCSKLHKGDALGELFIFSKYDIKKRPIVIIENITCIPKEEFNHDSLEYVENLLLHGWKETTRYFTNTKYGDFSLETRNYTVLIPWRLSEIEKVRKIWHRQDGFAWLNNYEEDLSSWQDDKSE